MLQTIRYRFLLFAGIFPYLLGSAVAFHVTGSFHFPYFILGFISIAFVLVAVEIFNEYFDIKLGTDRVFSFTAAQSAPPLRMGLVASAIALMIGLYLALVRGWPLLVFIAFGALAVMFYVGPPIRWSYRGLGELTIFLAYGPFMTLGSYYLQAQGVDIAPLTASLVLGFLVLALALINEVPDYYGDRLVGKKNIVVRVGRRRAVALYAAVLFLSFAILPLGVHWGMTTGPSLLIFVTLPLACWNVLLAGKNYDRPRQLVPAIRGTALLYAIVACLLIASYLV
ncbi:MAG: prenyltransferase [Candidatus Hadarchaeaceae archaeon]